MEFINTTNGYTESKTPWLGVLLLGPLYYIINGMWGLAFSWIIVLNILFFFIVVVSQNAVFAAIMSSVIVSIIYTATANNSVRSHYLKKGWVEITTKQSNEPVSGNSIQPLDKLVVRNGIIARLEDDARDITKECPFCAEEVLFKAIKCKHCGSDISTTDKAP